MDEINTQFVFDSDTNSENDSVEREDNINSLVSIIPKVIINSYLDPKPEADSEQVPELIPADLPIDQPIESTKEDIVIKSNKKNTGIAAILMVKNESLRIEVTLTSILGFASTLIIYDTGSTDDTVNIITRFCRKYKISLYLTHGTFVDFSTSRNVLLSFAETVPDVDFLLMLDCNDELQNGGDLIKFCKTAPVTDDAFFLKQSWKSGIYIHYYNIRLLRAKSGWRYKGVVHEYIYKEGYEAKIRVPKVVLFQDRTKDDDKSYKRFNKDKELLLGEYNSENKTPRTVYYLAQTYECLSDKINAIKYYTERMYLVGYYEERYQAAYHVGMLYREECRPFEEYAGFFMFAFGIMHRSEPLVRIAEHYIAKQQWTQAYYYLKEACKIDPPDCGLFLDIELYNYYRWHLMGIVAYYVKEHKDGLHACKIAIEKRNNDIDKHNLIFYKNELNCTDDHTKLSLL